MHLMINVLEDKSHALSEKSKDKNVTEVASGCVFSVHRDFSVPTLYLKKNNCFQCSSSKNLMKVAVNIVPWVVGVPAFSVLLNARPGQNCNVDGRCCHYLNMERSSVIIRFLVFSPGTFVNSIMIMRSQIAFIALFDNRFSKLKYWSWSPHNNW